ncbi:MAG: hypothetical protein H6716_24540 [Polyangiaceae bacterium]|nr:hypothetical protein [Polyangiaceae bacterium]
MGLLVLDLAVDVVAGKTCVVAALMPDNEQAPEPSRAWPPDLRHANERAVTECLGSLLGRLDEPPARLLYRVFDTASERADVALLELLEWHVYAALLDDMQLECVMLPDRGAVRGDGPLHPIRVDGEDVARVVLGTSSAAACLDRTPPRAPTVRVTTYGVPQTPVAQAVVRAAAVWLLSEGTLPSTPIADPSEAPGAEELNRLRALSALVAQSDLHAYGIAETKVWFDRRGGFGGRVGSDLASRVLDRAWQGPPAEGDQYRDAAALRRCLGVVAGVLDARAGDYEAPEEILKRAFGGGSSASGSRADALFGRQAFTLAAALAQRAFVANHRGDTETARNALARAYDAAGRETSLRAAVLRLECLTFMAVACQDAWPYAAPGDQAREDLVRVEQRLGAAVESFRQVVQALPASDPARAADAQPLDLGELGVEAPSNTQDPALGAALGTLGRTRAFLGDHDAAARTLLEARSQFATELDRAVNAAFLAHLELDRGPQADAARLECVLSTLAPAEARTPSHAIARLRVHDFGFRFTLDIVLKTLAAGVALHGTSAAEWQEALMGDDLFGLLAVQRSHPTELIGRHAGEVLQRAGHAAEAQRWFTLSVQVAAAGGSALQRTAVFTNLLAQHGAQAATGPRGCLTNPCYAQR